MLKQTISYAAYAILRVSKTCENEIAACLSDKCGIRRDAIRQDLHLTVYRSQTPILGLKGLSRPVQIKADASETRFMVMVTGGEVKRPGIDPGQHLVGIRLTKRNQAIGDIQLLRESVSQLESHAVSGNQNSTTAWKDGFGDRRYQPHITLLQPGSKIGSDLTKIGGIFRSEIDFIEFDLFQVRTRTR